MWYGMLPPVKQEEPGTHHMGSTLADRGTQVGCLEPVVVDVAKASGQRHVVVRIKGEWMSRTRDGDRDLACQPCGNPFRLPMGHVIGCAPP